MTADVISHPRVILDGLADRIRVAFARTEQGRAEWIEGTLDLASALAEARERHGDDDRAFSVWLAQNGLDMLGKDDRASLINMAADINKARCCLQETKRNSWQWIWREEMEPMFRQMTKHEAVAPSALENEENEPKTAIIEPSHSENVAETVTPEVPKAEVSDRSPFHGIPNAEVFEAIYTQKKTRTTVSKLVRGNRTAAREIREAILACVDAGFLKPTDMSCGVPSLRLLFPEVPVSMQNAYDLEDAKARKKVRDYIMPAALANREAVIASPEKFDEIIRGHWQREQAAAQEVATKRKVAEAIEALPEEQRTEIIMFGHRLWPRDDSATYEYDELRVAIWYFRDMDKWLSSYGDETARASVRGRGILIRNSTRWWNEFVDRALSGETKTTMKRAYQLVHKLTALMEQNPNGDCRPPPSPKIEGQW